jgi:hypothetical protein
MQKPLVILALCLAGTIFPNFGIAQPVGGPTSGGNDPTGGNTTGGNAGGNTTGGNVGGGNINTGGNVGVNLGEERRFTVEFSSFIALDETGCDYCGSDEVNFVIRTPDYSLISSQYDEIDAPLFWDTPKRYLFVRCAQPAVDGDNETNWEWECDQKGKAPPFSFTIAAYEDDGPWGDDCWTDQLYRGPDGQYTDLYPANYQFCLESEGRAELIGKKKVELSLDDLNSLAVGAEVARDVELEGCDATKTGCNSGGAPHYRLTYVITRVPDASGGLPVNPNP